MTVIYIELKLVKTGKENPDSTCVVGKNAQRRLTTQLVLVLITIISKVDKSKITKEKKLNAFKKVFSLYML